MLVAPSNDGPAAGEPATAAAYQARIRELSGNLEAARAEALRWRDQMNALRDQLHERTQELRHSREYSTDLETRLAAMSKKCSSLEKEVPR